MNAKQYREQRDYFKKAYDRLRAEVQRLEDRLREFGGDPEVGRDYHNDGVQDGEVPDNG